MSQRTNAALEAYVPRLAVQWLRETPDQSWKAVEGTLAFVDISGFTALTERLAKQGKVGAEQMSDHLSTIFSELLAVAYRDGAGLVKWGGDAVLLLFEGQDHAARAARATYGMREKLKRVGQIGKGKSKVLLRMSVGIHSDTFYFFLVGDPEIHRELLISGPAASRCAEMEAIASADEIGLTAATATLIDPNCLGDPVAGGFLLASPPALESKLVVQKPSSRGIDLKQLLPTNIRAHLLERQGEAEHRKIGVAFVQFSGTDELLAQEGPAALAEALDECIRSVQHASARYSVTFFETDINRDGGKIMLTAGAPASSDHNDERILRASSEIAGRIGRLPVRIGVNRGEVFSGDFGPTFRRTYSVKGDAINLAARLLGRAEPGQVVATTTVLDQSGVDFEREPLAPFVVKGKSQPVHAARVGRPVDSVRETIAASILVGRDAELCALHEALDDAGRGKGRFVELSGEPGIGKTRLVEQCLAETSLRILATRCDEYEISTPYWPFRALLRGIVEVAEDADDDTVVSALITMTTARDTTLLPWLTLVAETMDIPMESTPEVDALAEEFRKARREDAVARFVAITLTEPTVLAIDDVHLMDDASAELLERISRDLVDSSRLVLVTRRDQERGFRPSDEYPVVRIRPEPLTPDAAQALIAHELANAAITSHDVTLIVKRASGNPLFLRGLIEAARNGERVDTLPDRVEDLITSQIDQLPPAERTVLRYASVLGVAFTESELRALLQDRPLPTSRSSLRRLSYFIRQDGRGRYHFEHRLLRDTAYEGLPFRTRRELHGRAAELIETTSADGDDVAELLSMHFLHAKQPEKAWHYANIAGRRAAAKYAHGEAEELFSRAIVASRGLRGLSDQEKAATYIALADAQKFLGRNNDAVANLARARRRLSNDPLAKAAVYRRQASIQRDSSQLSSALRSIRLGIDLLGEDQDSDRSSIRSRLLTARSGCLKFQGKHTEALASAKEAMASAQHSADPEALGDANMAVHNELLYLGMRDITFGQRALALYEEAGLRDAQAHALNNLAFFEWQEGDISGALRLYVQASKAAQSSGDGYMEAAIQVNIAECLLELNSANEAEVTVLRILPSLRALGMHSFVCAAYRHLARAQANQGREPEASESLRIALTLAEQTEDVEEQVEALGTLAAIQMANSEFAACIQNSQVAEELAEANALHHALPRILRVQGQALIAAGNQRQAADSLHKALLLAEQFDTAEARRIGAILDLVTSF